MFRSGICTLFILVQYIQFCKAATYLYIAKTGNYDEGRQLCKDFGLDLAKVSSEQDIADLHAIYSNLFEHSEVAWLGLQYNTDKGRFYWADGTQVQHSRWNDISDDEPDDLPRSRCAVVKRSILLWHTRLCSNAYPVLCGPYIDSDTPEMRISSFRRWRKGKQFLANATSVERKTSSRACVKDCMLLGNCMFISMEGNTCNMYSDITSVETKNKDKSVIWKRNTITID